MMPLGLLLLALLLVAGARLFTGYPEATLSSALMSAREQAIVSAFADAFFPPAGPIPLSGTDAGVPRYFDDYLRRAAPMQRTLIRLLILYIELEPLLFGPRHVRFTRLTLDEQVKALESTGASEIYFRRVSFVSLRALMTMAYLASADVARHMNMVRASDPFGLGDRILERAPANPMEVHP